MSRIFLKASKFKDYKKLLVLILGLVLISSLIPLESAYAAAVTFDFPSSPSDGNLSGTATGLFPQIIADGTNVYTVWFAPTNLNINFSRSVDSGDTYSTPLSLGSTLAFSGDHEPQIATSGTGVYVVWDDGNNLKYSASIDSGASFTLGGTISAKTGCPCGPFFGSTFDVDPQIAATSQDVYVAWTDIATTSGAKIFLSSSSQVSNGFDTLVTLDDTTSFKSPPQVAATDAKVYVVWANETSVLLAASDQGGDSFGTIVTLGSGDSGSAPEIAAINNDVHVIWKDENDIVKYAKSVNEGTSFTTASNIGDASSSAEPQILVTGNKVYAAWEDDSSPSEISFRASTDSGASLLGNPSGSGTNLSSTAGASTNPKISASGANVYVVWKDISAAFGGDGDIVYVASSDSGSTFGTTDDASDNAASSDNPATAASGNKVYVASEEGSDVIVKTGDLGGPAVSFDKLEYNVKDTATITVDDSTSSGSGPISVKVTSTSDPTTGIFVDLSEIGSSGVFTGTITFTNSGSSNDAADVLEADSGDSLDATFGGNDGSSKIISSSIEIPTVVLGNVNELDYEETWGIKVTDENANLDDSIAETINVSLTSSVESVNIQLVETGLDTGIFGGAPLLSTPPSSSVIFMTGDHRVPFGNLEISLNYTAECDFCNSGVIDQLNIGVKSTSDTAGITITLDETGDDTKIFDSTLRLSPGSSVDGTTIKANRGDFVTIITLGSSVSDIRLLVIPTTQSRAAIQMQFPETGVPDVVQITYKDSAATLDPKDLDPKDEKGGGGGGGLVRPGLVVNVLAGGVSGGGGLPGPTITLGALALNNFFVILKFRCFKEYSTHLNAPHQFQL